jgi:hypothetical protein
VTPNLALRRDAANARFILTQMGCKETKKWVGLV